MLKTALALLAVALALTARAADTETRTFDVPAGEAGSTLKLFAQQARREIMFKAEPVSGVKTNPVQGDYTIREGLDRLLAGTGLVANEDAKTGALAVSRIDAPAAPPAGRDAPTTQEVTVPVASGAGT